MTWLQRLLYCPWRQVGGDPDPQHEQGETSDSAKKAKKQHPSRGNRETADQLMTGLKLWEMLLP